MKRKLFIRNVRAREQLELFIVSGITSLLLVRYYLHLTGYPQVGTSTLHISHMLWGGLFMLISMLLLLSFLGRRIERVSAVLGGIGFGIFIDEVGKFLTKDNNYFFRPSIGIIYAVFALLYLATGYLTRHEKLTSTEYQLNALNGMEEAVLREMDEHEKLAVEHLLQKANPHSNITVQLKSFLDSITPSRTESPGPIRRFKNFLIFWYERAWQARRTKGWVRALFIGQILFFVGAVIAGIFANVDAVQEFFHGHADYGQSLVIGQFAATLLAAWFAILGILRLRVNRIEALEWFRRATLSSLLLTEFFIFSRIQFGAMPGFLGNLVLYILINTAIMYERRSEYVTV